MDVLILIIHCFWKRTWIRLFVKIWKNRRRLLILHRDISSVTSGSSSALFLHVTNSRRSIWFWSTWAPAVLWTIFTCITHFVRFVFLKVLVKFVLVLIQFYILTKKEVITNKIVFLKVVHFFLFLIICIFKTLLNFNLIFIIASSRFIWGL